MPHMSALMVLAGLRQVTCTLDIWEAPGWGFPYSPRLCSLLQLESSPQVWKCSVPGTPGSCRSPASRPCTGSSEHHPGPATPPRRSSQPRPQRTPIPGMTCASIQGISLGQNRKSRSSFFFVCLVLNKIHPWFVVCTAG